MFEATCRYCEGDLDLLPSDHPEHSYTQLTSDGTRKWYLCKECGSVWCYEKLQKTWLMSPETYTHLVSEGKIPDLLNSE